MSLTESRGSVLVTGGARRIGRQICRRLAADGFRVVVHARKEGDADAVDLAAELGGFAVFGDLSNPMIVGKVFEDAVAVAADLRHVVNNASKFSTSDALTRDEADELMRVNMLAPLTFASRLSQYLAASGAEGSVVHLLDCRVLGKQLEGAAALRPTAYEHSKRSLADAVVNGARKYAPTMRVNGVAPGPVMLPADASNSEPGGKILLPSRPSAESVAAAVSFFLTTPHVTGQILAVDSGQSLV